jgi:phasin family protein
MNDTVEKITASSKVALEAAQAFATKAHASAEKLVELNMSTAKAALEDSADKVRAVLDAKDPQAFAAVAADLVKPLTEKSAAYAREFQKIVSDASADFTKTAQANLADVQKGFDTLMESATKSAPAGSESAFAFFNQAMTAGQNAFKTAQTTAQQAVETAQANFTVVSKQATDAVKKATKPA